MKGPHDYDKDCQCYRCKGIRNNPVSVLPKKSRQRKTNHNASRAEQYARYIDCGPANWDDR